MSNNQKRIVRVTLRIGERLRIIGDADYGEFQYRGRARGSRIIVRVDKHDEFTRVFFGKTYDLAEDYRRQQLAILRAHRDREAKAAAKAMPKPPPISVDVAT
jgi:hypothetical protein